MAKKLLCGKKVRNAAGEKPAALVIEWVHTLIVNLFSGALVAAPL